MPVPHFLLYTLNEITEVHSSKGMSDDHEKVPLTAEPANVDEPEEEGPATGSSKTVGLFSDRKPKNVWAGFASGAKNLGKGVACGVAAFVALPVHGFRTEGIKGGAKGLLAGTACPCRSQRRRCVHRRSASDSRSREHSRVRTRVAEQRVGVGPTKEGVVPTVPQGDERLDTQH